MYFASGFQKSCNLLFFFSQNIASLRIYGELSSYANDQANKAANQIQKTVHLCFIFSQKYIILSGKGQSLASLTQQEAKFFKNIVLGTFVKSSSEPAHPSFMFPCSCSVPSLIQFDNGKMHFAAKWELLHWRSH